MWSDSLVVTEAASELYMQHVCQSNEEDETRPSQITRHALK